VVMSKAMALCGLLHGEANFLIPLLVWLNNTHGSFPGRFDGIMYFSAMCKIRDYPRLAVAFSVLAR